MPFRSVVPSLRGPPSLSTSVFRYPIMATQRHCDSHLEKDPKFLEKYPVPLSPPLPLISKDIELSRAMSASSKSSLFSLSTTDVLLQDDWLIALNKPRGVYCDTILASVPSLLNDASHDSAEVSTMQSKKTEFHLANRLDRDTSGVMLVTKSHKVAAKLVKAFTDHKVRKTYIALCVGQAPKWEKITIKSGHGRSKFGAWRVYATKDVGRMLPGGSSVREMETLFEVISFNGDQCNKELSEVDLVVEEKSSTQFVGDKVEVMVRAYPRSGRTHQIRLHCQYLGIPVKGDVKYEGVYEWNGRFYDGHHLHAESLSFEHPMTGSPIVINAPLPLWATQGL